MKELIKKLLSHNQCDDDYNKTLITITETLSNGHKEELKNLVLNGPVYDGDTISKVIRDDLLKWGFASRAVIKGEQGYTVANYKGYDLLKAWG